MSIVSTYTREQWEQGGRFRQVEPYISGIFIVEPVTSETEDDPDQWSIEAGPPPTLIYEHWQPKTIEDGGGWEHVSAGDDYLLPEQVALWHKTVRMQVFGAAGTDASIDAKVSWPENNVDRLVVELALVDSEGQAPEAVEQRLYPVMRRIADALWFLGPNERDGFETVYHPDSRQQLFVWQPTEGDQARGKVQQVVERALAGWDGQHGSYQLLWQEYGAGRVMIYLLGDLDQPVWQQKLKQALAQIELVPDFRWTMGCWLHGRAMFVQK